MERCEFWVMCITWKGGNSIGMTNESHEKKRNWARHHRGRHSPKGHTNWDQECVRNTDLASDTGRYSIYYSGVISSSGCSKKDRTEAIFYKCQELLLNGIYSEGSGTNYHILIFLRMPLNDLEIQRN